MLWKPWPTEIDDKHDDFPLAHGDFHGFSIAMSAMLHYQTVNSPAWKRPFWDSQLYSPSFRGRRAKAITKSRRICPGREDHTMGCYHFNISNFWFLFFGVAIRPANHKLQDVQRQILHKVVSFHLPYLRLLEGFFWNQKTIDGFRPHEFVWNKGKQQTWNMVSNLKVSESLATTCGFSPEESPPKNGGLCPPGPAPRRPFGALSALSFKVLSFAIAWRSSQGGASGGLQFISIDLPIDGLEITRAIPIYEVYNIFLHSVAFRMLFFTPTAVRIAFDYIVTWV